MGSCVSLRRHPAAKANGQGFPASGSPNAKDSPGFGSKDEIFFESRAWLESDCEDDFFSVNGDFTPSRGSTPNYQTGSPVKPQLDKAFIFDGFSDTRSEPSPRKKLGEFLQGTLPAELSGNDNNIINGKLELNGKSEVNGTNKDHPPKSMDGTPYLSGKNSVHSGVGTPDDDYKSGKGKRGKAMQCCLPSLVHSLSINDRKKQTPSSAHQNGG